MKKAYIPKDLRDIVTGLAKNRCEYCLMPAELARYAHQLDHVISEKQNGPTILANLALACQTCNGHKGSIIARYFYEEKKLVRLFHPRSDDWNDFFELLPSGVINAKNDIGLGTVQMLNINLPVRVNFRDQLVQSGLYELPE